MKESAGKNPTRRDVVRGIGVAGLGAAATGPLPRRAFAQTKQPVSISFWTFDNP
jgi:multiple sugar transport system substrate-binding protein